MKQLFRFKQLNKRQKAEFAAASVLTAAFMAALPAYAWFANNKNLETITKIKEPGEMIIRAGKTKESSEADPVVNFELNDIDVESISKGTPQRFVFSVSPGESAFEYYHIQLAHTTNVPFTYTIYRAKEKDVSRMSDDQINALELTPYHAITTPNLVTYYEKVDADPSTAGLNEVTMTVLNENADFSNGKTAKQNDWCYSQTYGEESVNNVNVYAVPIYMQSAELNHSRESLDPFDYYILELGWSAAEDSASEGYKEWNTAQNNKETDIIYITAKRSSG